MIQFFLCFYCPYPDDEFSSNVCRKPQCSRAGRGTVGLCVCRCVFRPALDGMSVVIVNALDSYRGHLLLLCTLRSRCCVCVGGGGFGDTGWFIRGN